MLQRKKSNMPFKRKKPRAEPEGTLLSVEALGEEEEKEKGRRRRRRGGGNLAGQNTYIMHANCKDWM